MALPSWPAPAAAQEPDTAHAYRPGRLLVGFVPGSSPDPLVAAVTAQGMAVNRIYPEMGLIEVSLPIAEVAAAGTQAFAATEAAQATLAGLPGVDFVDKDHLVYAAQTDIDASPISNDPRVGEQWALKTVRAGAAWAIALGSSAVPVAVIDSGYDSTHPDLSPDRLWVNEAEQNGRPNFDDDGNGYKDDIHGWDWVDPSDQMEDYHGHGTHVFGIIAAETNNSIGVAGIAPALQIAPLRVLNGSGTGYVADVIQAIDYARSQGFRVANLSLTVSSSTSALERAVQTASAAGMLVVAAAGNDGDAVQWPAAYPSTLAVAATTSSDGRAFFSSHGPEVDLSAPGDSILSTYLDGAYRSQSGTSMASPYVAAAAAMVWSLRPDLTADAVVAILQETAVPLNDPSMGAGRLDVAAALAAASQGLTLAPRGQAAWGAEPGAAIAPQVTVTAPNNSGGPPVAGAVLHYRILEEPSGDPVGGIQTAVTDEDGTAALALFAPNRAGSYRVRIEVGESHLDIPLAVHAEVGVTLALTPAAAQAGGAPVQFRVEVRRTDDTLEIDTLPVQLATSLGSFSKSSLVQSQTLNVTGIYTGSLYPSTQAGIANVQASIGASSGQAKLTIVPGPAAQIVGPSAQQPVTEVATYQLAFTFFVNDRFGNPVVDGTRVEFAAASGQLRPASAETQKGRVSTVLDLADASATPSNLRVTVPGTTVNAVFPVTVTWRGFLPLLEE